MGGLWRRAIDVTTARSDEWGELNNISYSARPYSSSHTSFFDPVDHDPPFPFLNELRTTLKKLVETNDPEFLWSLRAHKTQFFFAADEEYEAKKAIFKVMLRAQAALAVVDPYLDAEVFDYLDSVDPGLELKLLTGQWKPIFKKLFVLFAKRRGKAEARYFNSFHDRFLMLDNTNVVHLGTSINYAGKKAFMLNEITDPIELKRTLNSVNEWWAKGQPIT